MIMPTIKFVAPKIPKQDASVKGIGTRKDV